MSKKIKLKKLTKKNLRVVTAILIAIFAVIVIAWSIINPSSIGANTSSKTQVIFGWDSAIFNQQYPNTTSADFASLWETGTKMGVTLYGIDSYLCPYDPPNYTVCNQKIPLYLSWLPAGMSPILPVSSYNWERLSAIYNYFVSKGWIDTDGNPNQGNNRKWLVFKASTADEPRANDRVPQNNAEYTAFHAQYPLLKWIVTDTALPIAQAEIGTLPIYGDVIIPNAFHDRIEYHEYNTYSPMQPQGTPTYVAAYAGKERGIYLSGSFPGNNDPTPMKPDYYDNAMKKLGQIPSPYVPTLLDHPEQILAYTHTPTVNAKYFLFWAGWQMLIPDSQDKPIFRPELIQLMSGRSQGY